MRRSLLLTTVLLATAPSLVAADRPNLLLIVCDDLNTQTLRDGSPVRVPTPNLDRLCAAGLPGTVEHRRAVFGTSPDDPALFAAAILGRKLQWSGQAPDTGTNMHRDRTARMVAQVHAHKLLRPMETGDRRLLATVSVLSYVEEMAETLVLRDHFGLRRS